MVASFVVLASCSATRPPVVRPGPNTGVPVVGAPVIVREAPALSAAQARQLWTAAQHVFETRCVVCHGCYDAPCQLKLDTYEGVTRGGTTKRVYDAARLVAAEPTQLFVDAHGTAAWRDKGFHPVVPEGVHADARASVLVHMLELKRAHPLLPDTDVAKAFTLDLDRDQTCADAEHIASYEQAHPAWGMPYALPGLDDASYQSVLRWARAGAPGTDDLIGLPAQVNDAVARWEDFLNGTSNKQRLAARYIYEHLFLASLYFEDGPPKVAEQAASLGDQSFFRMVRSRTPSGAPVDEIVTRRPFDDPGQAPFFYRLVRRYGRPLAKTHMPYALSEQRMARYRELFLEPSYEVEHMPSYDSEVSANPFNAFRALPVQARYRFMLDEAQFTMMGFIKGPVCRGQVALNVIQERFWVTFVDPNVPWLDAEAQFLADNRALMDLPAEAGSTSMPTRWFGLAKKHARYVRKKSAFLSTATRHGRGLTLATIWDGDGHNDNAALTVLRHFDSATVVKGLIGGPPKTAWVVDYALLEQIHYLLVAGFDVFGNVGHQLTTRLYMDFLRMEGEYNFLTLVPSQRRRPLVDFWYRGASADVKNQVYGELASFDGEPRIRYRTERPEHELFAKLVAHLDHVTDERYAVDTVPEPGLRTLFERIAAVRGVIASRMPELSFVTVVREAPLAAFHFTIMRDSAHSNVAQLFAEQERRVPEQDALTVVPGFLGAYPNALFLVHEKDFELFVRALELLDSDASYAAVRKLFGVLRTSDRFWPYSDRIHEDYRSAEPLTAGLFDFNRLDAN